VVPREEVGIRGRRKGDVFWIPGLLKKRKAAAIPVLLKHL
jgi:hypothetical protein